MWFDPFSNDPSLANPANPANFVQKIDRKTGEISKLAGLAAPPACEKISQRWIVTEPNREPCEVHCTPLATLAEVLEGRPAGTTASPAEQGTVADFQTPSQEGEAWRTRLWQKLDENPSLTYAIEVGLPPTNTPEVEIMLTRRGVGSFTMLVPRDGLSPLETTQIKILEFMVKFDPAIRGLPESPL